MKRQRKHNGKFSSHSYAGIWLMGITTSLSLYATTFQQNEIISPISDKTWTFEVEEVQAKEPIVLPTTAIRSEKQQIFSYIVEVFGDKANQAMKIAECESGFDPSRVGDQHLTTINNNEMVGDSIGIFQVRTGGEGWNRAKANGMSAEEFRTNLKNFKYNIDYAKTIYDQRGWSAWFNCMNKVGLK